MILSLAEDFVVFSIYIQLLQFGFSSPGLSILLGLGHIIITPPRYFYSCFSGISWNREKQGCPFYLNLLCFTCPHLTLGLSVTPSSLLLIETLRGTSAFSQSLWFRGRRLWVTVVGTWVDRRQIVIPSLLIAKLPVCAWTGQWPQFTCRLGLRSWVSRRKSRNFHTRSLKGPTCVWHSACGVTCIYVHILTSSRWTFLPNKTHLWTVGELRSMKNV